MKIPIIETLDTGNKLKEYLELLKEIEEVTVLEHYEQPALVVIISLSLPMKVKLLSSTKKKKKLLRWVSELTSANVPATIEVTIILEL